MDVSLATAAFWLFLAVVIGSLIWRKTLQRREVLITLRTALDRGLALDDPRLRALLAAAGSPDRARRRLSHDFFLVFGIILAAGGLCLFVLALFGAEPAPLVALGLCAEVMGGALVILWRIFARRAERNGQELP
jgi:hypothetical protein